MPFPRARLLSRCRLTLAAAALSSCASEVPATFPDSGAEGGAEVRGAEVRGAEVPATFPGDGGADGAAGACGVAGAGASFADWGVTDPAGRGVAPSFDVSAAGVVLDRITGLMWQRMPEDRGRGFTEAAEYCSCLQLGGHDDWRVPSRVELVSIVDFTRHDPAIDPVAFPATSVEYFWTSSPAADSPTAAWFIAFFDGNTHSREMDSEYRVRCVRRANPVTSPQPRYVVRPEGIVLDQGTKLLWQREGGPELFTFSEAQAHCAGLPLAGGGWRLPNMKELQTLVDERTSDPAIDGAAFPGTPPEAFWASSPLAGMPGYGWFVSFSRGIAYNSLVERPQHVRCVR